MIQSEISEIRRRLSHDKGAIGKIYGCFVNNRKEIISYIDTSLATMYQSDGEKYLALFKKIFSGGIGRSMIDIEFTTKQVMESDEHRLLMCLKESQLKDQGAREALFSRIINSVHMNDESFLILLTCDDYDVPVKSKDGESYNDSETVFSYFVCCVCPVKEGKEGLGYIPSEQEFKTYLPPMSVCPPKLGFMFPAFQDRAASIYNTLFYTKDPSDVHDEFISTIFGTEIPMSATVQHDTFADTLTDTLENECSFEVVQTVHRKIRERIAIHKESRDPEPMELDAEDVGAMLKSGGVSSESAEVFEEKCAQRFGDDANLNPENIINSKFDTIVIVTHNTNATCIEYILKNSKAEDRARALGASYLLLFALGQDGISLDKLPDFSYTKEGKPYLREYPEIYFNLSHTKNIITCVISSSEVGVDTEHKREVNDATIKRVFTENEKKMAESEEEGYLRHWTMKESCAKLIGTGLSEILDGLEVIETENGKCVRKLKQDIRNATSYIIIADGKLSDSKNYPYYYSVCAKNKLPVEIANTKWDNRSIVYC